MKIERIDHLNLTVADIDRSLEFYKRVLGMQAESVGEGRARCISDSRRYISTRLARRQWPAKSACRRTSALLPKSRSAK